MRLTCRNCGSGFEQRGRGRPAHGCSAECRRVLAREKARSYPSSYVPRPPVERECRNCGQTFGSRNGAKYCSPKCSTRAQALGKFGLTPVSYAEMVLRQGGRCASCGDEFQGRLLTHVDHCHTTGAVRGLLCQGCNVAIGHLAESPDRARRVASYLERCAA